MSERKNIFAPRPWAAALCVALLPAAASAQVTTINGFIVERNSEANDPGGTNQQAYPLSNLVATDNGLSSLQIFEDSYDNEPADPGFSANRTNSWFTANGTDRFGLSNGEAFEVWVTVNLDTGYFNRNNRKEAGIIFQRDDDPAANSLFLVTADTETAGQVPALGTSGAAFPLTVFSDIDPVNGVYEHDTDARLGFIYTPPGPNVVQDPATYEFIYDPGADGIDPITSGPVDAVNFGGISDGTHIGLMVQNNVADGLPQGDPTIFANEFIDVTFSDVVFIDPNAPLVGDYNADGFVSQGDLDLVLLNWGDGVAPAGFDEAALPGGGPFDGLVSQNELDGVLLNWGNGTPPPANAVPEPATALLALPLLAGALGRRRLAAPR